MWAERGSRKWTGTVKVAILLLTGCGEDLVGPGEEFETEAAEAVATFLVDVDGTAGWSTAVVAEVVDGTREFSRTMSCPAGGVRTVSGGGTTSVDRERRTFSTTWSTTLTHEDCAFQRGRRDGTVAVVIDGSVTAEGSASYQLSEDRRQRQVLLAYEATRVGTVSTTIGDRTRRCDIDLRETYDPRAGSFRVTGTACGRAVNLTRTRAALRDATGGVR